MLGRVLSTSFPGDAPALVSTHRDLKWPQTVHVVGDSVDGETRNGKGSHTLDMDLSLV